MRSTTRTAPRHVVGALAAGLALTMAACAPGGAESSVDEDLDQVTLLTNFRIVFAHYSDLYGAVEEGIFAEHGVDMLVQPGQTSADTVAQVAAGTAQFGIVDPVSGMVAIEQGAEVTFVASRFQSYTGSVCWSEPENAIETWADLVGKDIGGATGDAFVTALPLLMEQNGVEPDIEVITLDSNAQQGALISGQIDLVPTNAVGLADKELGLTEHGKDIGCFRFAEHGAALPGFAMLVNNELIDSDPDLVQRVVDAYAEAVLWGLEHPEPAVDAFMDAFPDRDREAVELDFGYSEAFLDSVATDPELGVFALVPEYMEGAAELAASKYDSEIAAEDTYTNRFVEELPAESRNP